MLKNFRTSSIARLRLISLIEGLSLILLVLIAVPLKYYFGDDSWVKSIGPVHGGLFVLFVVMALWEAFSKKWSIGTTAMVILIASFIPFGCFYVDSKILKAMDQGKD
ncbi:MAG: DUF3817 domain-containing protein [Croceimicrobium sp.]|nr:DUF3817 domain-containing protein [Bacteroidota bacterium]